MKILERIATAMSVLKAPPVPTAAGPSIFQLAGRNTASSSRPTQGNLADSLSRYADEAWIYACVRIIQIKGAEVPLRVYKLVNGKKTELPDHPLQKLLDSVNPFMDRSQLMEGTHGFKELAGNAFWLLDKMVGARPTEIHLINPAHMKPMVDKKAGLVGYEYRLNGVLAERFAAEEIIHFRYWNPLDPFWGQPPISAGRDGADMIKRADQYNIAFFANSAEAGGFLTTDKPMHEDAISKIKAAWAKNHQGARKAHKIEILHGGLEWKSNATSHKDMLFPELKRMSREDVLTCYQIPPVMAGIFDEANYSNADAQERIFWKFMKARLASLDSVLTERLGKPFDDVIIEHDLSGIQELQEDQKLKSERDRVDITTGIKTINEVRAERNLPPVKWGDVWWSTFGATPISDGEPIIEEPAPVEPPVDDEPEPEDPPKKDLPARAKERAETPEVDPNLVRRDTIWVRYKGLTEKLERRWVGPMHSLFNDQEREVVENLRASDWQKAVNQNRLDHMKSVKASIDVILFDRSNARSLFRKTAKGLMEYVLGAAAADQIEEYGLGIDFKLNDPNVVAWIASKSFKFANEVNSTTEEALRSALSEAISAGETITQVEDRIAGIFDIARGSRTAMIARTEVISASNEGAHASYKQSGVVESQEWISSRDEKVRDAHKIDGEVVKLDAHFSNGLKYPGDPDGEPGEVINCRCTIAPIVKRDE